MPPTTPTADGLRTGKDDTRSGTLAHNDFSWSPLGLLWSSNPNTVYTPGFGHRSNGVNSFYQTDWLGSTRYVTDLTGGTVTAAQSYDAWGNVDAQAPGSPNHPTDLMFAGGWAYQTEWSNGASEPGVGLQYLQQRYYDPAVGRFISPDPAGVGSGTNLFEYANDDPVGGVDPGGMLAVPWDALWVAADFGIVTWDGLTHASNATKALDWSALGLDTLALATPGAPSGEGRVLVMTGHGAQAAATLERVEHQLSLLLHFAVRSGGPNPGGRRGGEPHRDKVEDELAGWKANGWSLVAGGPRGERKVDLPNGRWRFPDLWLEKHGLYIAIQVGRSTRAGLPVAREVRAMTDLIDSTVFDDVIFVPYR